MPELPEVESIRLQLKKYIVGHKITDVEIRYGKKFEGDKKKILGTRIQGIRRFAKALSIDLDNGYSVVIHIKLTGQLIYRGPNLKSKTDLSRKIIGGLGGKHTHVIFHLDNPPSHKASEGQGAALYYNDVRKFGWIKIIQTSKIKTQSEFIGKLGPEPLVTDSSSGQAVLTLEVFENILSKTSRPIKIILMDQSKISGIGNIYANDALWLAKVNPRKPANVLSKAETKELFDAIHKVLKGGLKYGGASELAFVTPDGSEGEYQNHTLIYGCEGELCKRPVCQKKGFMIKKFFLSGRGTYFCPECQT
jgi:formamidopyrimidine-DNA glycosylase